VAPLIERFHDRLQRPEKKAKQFERLPIGMTLARSRPLFLHVEREVGVMSHITGTGFKLV